MLYDPDIRVRTYMTSSVTILFDLFSDPVQIFQDVSSALQQAEVSMLTTFVAATNSLLIR